MDAVRALLAAPSIRSDRVQLAIFTATIFLSASLLFAVQPMFAKIVLPKLGGSPSVWAVSMCFFQAVLLGGYCYAHALIRFLEPRSALLVHLGVLALAALALPIGLPTSAEGVPSGNAYLWLIGVLAAGVGLPFFAVSANAPLVQAWFSRTGHPHAADPYFLYAASNIGSLLALLAYPVAIEPILGLSAQAAAWSTGFALLAAAIATCGLLMLTCQRLHEPRRALASSPAATPGPTAALVGTSQRLAWICLSFVPSALLVAATTFITTDIASAPFLWVIPLAIFLATFVMVFRDEPLLPHAALVERQPLVSGLAVFTIAAVGALNGLVGFLTALAAFVVTSLICHRELYLRRPRAEGLTEFYLWMSAGGVLGGIFSALVAPQLFTSIFEFPLLLVVGLLARPSMLALRTDRAALRQAAILIAVGLVVIGTIHAAVASGVVPGHDRLRVIGVAVLLALALVSRKSPARELGFMVLMLAALVALPEGRGTYHAVRSFFGVHRVVETPAGDVRILMHGTTAHGAQRMLDLSGRPAAGPVPATYYHRMGPIARSLDLVRRPDKHVSAGIIGLGAGSMACHAKPDEAWRLYEIDQAVVDIARDGRLFGFLSRCLPNAEIVTGDARLTLAREPDASFDYLLVDAFSSDAIPVHLMTVESLSLYLSKLRPGGVLAMHVTNRHMRLAPVVAANVAAVGGLHALYVQDMPAQPGVDAAPSMVVLVAREEETLAPALSWPGASRLAPTGFSAWTDDYSNVLSAIVAGWRP